MVHQFVGIKNLFAVICPPESLLQSLGMTDLLVSELLVPDDGGGFLSCGTRARRLGGKCEPAG